MRILVLGGVDVLRASKSEVMRMFKGARSLDLVLAQATPDTAWVIEVGLAEARAAAARSAAESDDNSSRGMGSIGGGSSYAEPRTSSSRGGGGLDNDGRGGSRPDSNTSFDVYSGGPVRVVLTRDPQTGCVPTPYT